MIRIAPSGEIATKAFMSTTGALGAAGTAAATAPPSVGSTVMHPARRRPSPAAEASRKKRREVFTVLPLSAVSRAVDQTSRVTRVSTPAAVLLASRLLTIVPSPQ